MDGVAATKPLSSFAVSAGSKQFMLVLKFADHSGPLETGCVVFQLKSLDLRKSIPAGCQRNQKNRIDDDRLSSHTFSFI